MIQDLAALLWVVNLGCIDLNPWYARCDDVGSGQTICTSISIRWQGAPFERVLETALIVRDALANIQIPSYAKTTGSRGIHVYVPIERGPRQKQVWQFAKAFAKELAKRHPKLITAEYRVAKRPHGARAGRLQPERVGSHARVGVFGAAEAGRDRVDSGYLEGSGAWRAAGRFHHAHRTAAAAKTRRSLEAAARAARARQSKAILVTLAPGGLSRWSTKHSMEWQPLEPKLVVEVQFAHFTGGRFRHGTGFLRWRPEKSPRDCTMEQVQRENRSALDLL